ncbi:MAG: hypothetical protein ACYDEJ_14930, partial [Desulfitobacteriaceae bacterium]
MYLRKAFSNDRAIGVNYYCMFASATFATRLTISLHAKTSGYFCINVRSFYAIHGKAASVHPWTSPLSCLTPYSLH